MGTRGAFGVVIDATEKIGYNQLDSYPSGYGVENLRWLRTVIENDDLELLRQAARDCRVVSEEVKPTKKDVEALAPYTNLDVQDQSTQSWYCLTRGTHGRIGDMLACGYIEDHSTFPLDSLFCEWAYIVDFDEDVFEVYEGFQASLPQAGRWRGRPTPEEDEAYYVAHLKQCAKEKRDPWMPEVSEYKAVELVARIHLGNLPSDERFLSQLDLITAERALDSGNDRWIFEDIILRDLENDPQQSAWEVMQEKALLKLGPAKVTALAGERTKELAHILKGGGDGTN